MAILLESVLKEGGGRVGEDQGQEAPRCPLLVRLVAQAASGARAACKVCAFLVEEQAARG